MKSYQAIALRKEFPDLPQSRELQERLIMQIYPAGTLRGRPLQECSYRQIYSVAERLYRQAGKQSELSHPSRVEEFRSESGRHERIAGVQSGLDQKLSDKTENGGSEWLTEEAVPHAYRGNGCGCIKYL